ncbi:MAG: HAD-IC family P-type ATPase [Clostridia bacterium]
MELNGLTKAKVDSRTKEGKVNIKSTISSKSYGEIIYSNVFTLFNIINCVLAGLIIWVHKYNQIMFLGLIIMNTFIGLFQEIRAKKTIDKLSLISQPKATVVRDGEKTTISTEQVVIDDLLIIEAGGQIISDCKIIDGMCEVDESMLTGESDAVVKKIDDTLLSGSFLISGKVFAKVTHVGANNYATKLGNSAKVIKSTKAEIPVSLKAIIKIMSFIVIPLGIGTFVKSYLWQNIPLSDSILKMAASSISMIPQGLVALSSVVFAASIVRLAKYKTLSQDLYCIETLARVDTLCLDKTGTITEGSMELDEIIDISQTHNLNNVICALTTVIEDKNPTANAIREFCEDNTVDWVATNIVPFSSARKWSGATFDGIGTFIMGASEFILSQDQILPYLEKLNEYSRNGERVLCIAYSPNEFIENNKPNNINLLGFLLISDKIRKEAPITLQYFYEQDVDIRVISGDNPVTVSAIAQKAGVRDAQNYIDASTLKTKEDIENASRLYKVFGRVSPEQKLQLIKALKNQGHTVAMTGDGVNDVLALKEADCSIAMASGSDASRTVAHLVLLDNNFGSLPKIVAEGRRTINNLQRTASLYLVKTIYATILAIFFLFVGEYPFEPMHLTLIGAVAYGFPSLILALEPNKELVKGRFLTNCLNDALPGALAIFSSMVLLQILDTFIGINNSVELANISVMIIAGISFGVLLKVCLPLNNPLHLALYVGMIIAFLVGWNGFSRLFNLMPASTFNFEMVIYILPLLAVGWTVMILLTKYLTNRQEDFPVINKILGLDKRDF